jgi:hypothetical protein
VTLRYLTSALLIALLAGCAPPEPSAPEAVHDFKPPLSYLHPVPNCTISRPPCKLLPNESSHPPVPSEAVAREAANDIIAALKRRDMAAIAKWAHPFRGVRFSPSVFVNPETDQVWSAAELPAWFEDRTPRVWGSVESWRDYKQRGSSSPTYSLIRMTPTEYYERYIFDRDYSQGATIRIIDNRASWPARPDEGDIPESYGNNVAGLYPTATQVVFYFQRTPEQAAQDDKSRRPDRDVLRLVFVGDGQSARESVRLLAIVHD